MELDPAPVSESKFPDSPSPPLDNTTNTSTTKTAAEANLDKNPLPEPAQRELPLTDIATSPPPFDLSVKRASTHSYESSELSDLADDDSEAETDKMDFLDEEGSRRGDTSDLVALSELTELARLQEVDSDDSDDFADSNGRIRKLSDSNDPRLAKRVKLGSPDDDDDEDDEEEKGKFNGSAERENRSSADGAAEIANGDVSGEEDHDAADETLDAEKDHHVKKEATEPAAVSREAESDFEVLSETEQGKSPPVALATVQEHEAKQEPEVDIKTDMEVSADDGGAAEAGESEAEQAHVEEDGAAGDAEDAEDEGDKVDISEEGAEKAEDEDEDDEEIDEQAEDNEAANDNDENADNDGDGDNDDDNENDNDVDMDDHRRQAIDELVLIEEDFAELRDKLYHDKLALLEHELALCLDGLHPELLQIYYKVNEFYQESIKTTNATLNYSLRCINNETVATRTAVHQQFLKLLVDMKNDMITKTTLLWYKINKERNLLDLMVPEMEFTAIPSQISTTSSVVPGGSNSEYFQDGFPVSRKHVRQDQLVELVAQRNSFNEQLGILNGIKEFHGIPSAVSLTFTGDSLVPAQELLLRRATADEINDDLRAMGIAR